MSTNSTRTRVRAAIALAALASAVLVPAPAAAATVPPTITCTYRLNTWPGGFSADLVIANSGPAIDGWTARWTFATPTRVMITWAASLTQPSPYENVATPVPWNRVIGTGKSFTFGWTAAAPATEVPTDITINGVPC
ncbi:hypothetical protein F4553_007838 [Allocatelliglobosispora scoriae]|uniref:CBM2 domain-containing protein n=1 Tax=Allocatelliglobosispora scoriae TaxID=643052 RepID=A0A841C229_9ACTN|nr:cellulose binding domain-containing protein [Allocatelliglobosispora scoriae]MBB5874404.1 hypothetical protein [Allocatelliglobosispora scoriae]